MISNCRRSGQHPGPGRPPVRRPVAVAVAAVLGLTVVAAPNDESGAAQVRPVRTVIVLQGGVLPASGPARSAAVAHREAPLTAAIRASGADVVARIGLIDAVVARVDPAQQALIASRPGVAAVVPDRRIRVDLPAPIPTRPTAAARRAGVANPTRAVYSHACPPNPAKPEVDPEALTTMRVRARGGRPGAWHYANGTGVRVGIVGTGINPDEPDLVRRNGTRVIQDYTDVTGAGLSGPVGSFESFIDAESVAAQGRQVFDLNQQGLGFIDPPGCTLRIRGVAPGATVDLVQAFDINGFGSVSGILRAIDHLVSVDHVDVLNESINPSAYPSTGADDPLVLADNAAVAAGVTVIASSGDSGIGNTLASPADDPRVLAVGATDQLRALEQIGYAGAQGRWSDGNIANLSSSGIALDGKTLDTVAPGFYSWVSCTPSPDYPDCPQTPGGDDGLELAGGTSESAPLTAGVAALVIQTYREHHDGRSPSPQTVDQIITGTADDLGAPSSEQGAGQVDALRAVRAAAAWDAAGTGAALAVTPTQADLTAPTGVPVSTDLQVTNHGSAQVSDTIGVRAESPAGVARYPFTYDQGSADYQVNVFRVHVPAGTRRLAITGLVADPTTSTYLDVYVFDPHGTYVADADPQGLTNTNYAEIDSPRAGTYTVKTYGVSLSDPTYTGPAEVDVRFYRDSAAPGTVTPGSLTLAPGATGTVHVDLPAAATAVDGTATVQLTDTTTGATTDVPVTVRRSLPLIAGAGSFSGSLTGGNGRTQGSLEGTGFDIDVPAGAPALQAHLALPALAGLKVFAYLVAPDGTAQDRETNVLDGQPQDSVDLAVPDPCAGRWHLTFGVDGTLPGTTDAVPYSGTITTDAPPVSATGLPHGATLAGPLTATIHVVNDTAATHTYIADPRTRASQATRLPVASPFPLPIGYTNPAPTVTVPPFSNGLLARGAADHPVSMELQLGSSFEDEAYGQWNDPVVLGTTGRHAQAFATGSPLTTGLWRIYPQPTKTATATTTLHATAITAAFDRHVRTSTGDPWTGASDTPLTLAPGQAGDIQVTITPQHSASGFIAVESWDATHTLASVLATLSYSYRA